MGRPADMLPLQYDQPYIWCPNIYSRPFELYALYKCRAGHQVFSKVTLSQGVAQLNQHYMASAEHIIGRIQLLAEYNCWQNTQLAEHTIGRTQWSAEQTVRIHCRQNTLWAEHNSGTTCYQQSTIGIMHCSITRTAQHKY